jgi:sortase A
VLAVAAIVAGLWCCAFAVALVYGTAATERAAQAILAEHLHVAAVAISSPRDVAAPPTATTPVLGAPIGRLVIPAISLNQVVVQGTGEAQLEDGPGHYPATPLPGQAGDAAIAGHRTTWARPFWSLDALRPGDQIIVGTPEGRFTYAVQWTAVVLPTDLAAIPVTAAPSLTLSTCTPRFSASHRLLVHAVLTSSSLGRRPRAATWARPLAPRRGSDVALLAFASVATLLAGIAAGCWREGRRSARLALAVVAVAAMAQSALLATHLLPQGF